VRVSLGIGEAVIEAEKTVENGAKLSTIRDDFSTID